MADKTKIAWADASWSPFRGCSKVSPGCKNCWAERMAARGLPGLKSPTSGDDFAVMTSTGPHWTGQLELIESQLQVPLHWKRPRRIFVNSMSDTFHERIPDDAIDRVFAVMALCPQHTFICCTKRAKRARIYMTNQPGLVRSIKWAELAMSAGPRRVLWKCHNVAGPDRYFFGYVFEDGDDIRQWPGVRGYLPNVTLLASVEDQQRADERIPDLLATPAAARGISLEPLLSPVDLRQWLRGDEPHDRSRTSISSPSGNRRVFHRQQRPHLEESNPGRREPRGDTFVRCSPGGAAARGAIGVGGLSESDVQVAEGQTAGVCASGCLDGDEPERHPRSTGSQPQGWEPRKPSPIEFGDCDAQGKHTAQLQGVGPQSERTARREEYIYEAGRGGYTPDSLSLQESNAITEQGGRDVQGFPAIHLRHPSAKDVDARSIGEIHSTAARLDWVIVGAESGPGARPMNEDWVRSVRDQCVEAGVAFFYKQRIENGRKVETPFLDGRQWMQFPEVAR